MLTTELKLKKKRLNAQRLKEILEAKIPKKKFEEVSIPHTLQHIWVQHIRLKARIMKIIPFRASNRMMSYLMEERSTAGDVEDRWIRWKLRRMKNRPARNPDKNPEIWPDKEIIVED